ncbi:AMP_1a_G0012470.mRNA.1.CDS.1 [Saccharomyces cerevisiae]|nr:AMP_1a_G0012470.mRNA.1.CDS.1 [Saccharomyces cerevisiae]CAI6513015.1 AMP_1a_G0012470.mRNA.1.CDS.1 [Saccharomyces cerevisiae]
MSYSFLDFSLTKLNIFSSMVLTYTSAQRSIHTIRIMQGLSKDVRALCLLGWPESIVSEDSLREALAVERMLRNDEEYKEYLEDIEPYHGDPVGYLKYFSVKKERSTLRYREIMLGTWPLLEEKQLVYWIRQKGKQRGKFSACLEGRSKVVL